MKRPLPPPASAHPVSPSRPPAGALARACPWLPAPPAALPPGAPVAQCSSGASTSLQLGGRFRSPHHNGNDGEAHFVLEAKDTASVFWKGQLAGEGVCFGFNVLRRAHVVGLRKQHGIGARLTRMFYINEVRPGIRASAFNKNGIEAFAAVPSSDLNYVALIAIDRNETSLFVLDIQKNRLRKLGKAPLPPPLTNQEREFAHQHPDRFGGRWEWMAPFRDSYMALDPSIVEFQGAALLQVSYGADTADQRARQRDVVTWDLSKSESVPTLR